MALDPVARIEKATAECGEAVKGIKADQLDDPTPCSDFTVEQLLQHLIGGLDMLRDAATGGKPGAPDAKVDPENFAKQYDEGRAKLLDVLKDPGVLGRTWSMPFGDMPGAMMAGIAFMEHLTHAWDVRKATGQPTSLPEGLVQECLDLVKPMDAMLRMPGVCGPAVAVPETAPLTDQLVGFMGRQP
ncbi:MAG: TIGR03086 family metal-binding protein [Actinomycetota bacterium]